MFRFARIAGLFGLVAFVSTSQPSVAFDQLIHDIQQALVDLGYDPGPIDGQLGQRTLDALGAAETALGQQPAESFDDIREYLLAAVSDRADAGKSAELPVQVSLLGPSTPLVVTSDLHFYASPAGSTPTVYEAASGRKVRSLYGHEGFVTDLAISPDGSKLASADHQGVVYLWDIVSGAKRQLDSSGIDFSMPNLAFTADGSRLVLTGRDGHLLAFDVSTAREVMRIEPPQINERNVSTMTVSADGREAIWSADTTIAIAELATGQMVAKFSVPGLYVADAAIVPGTDKVVVITRDKDENAPDADEFLGGYFNEIYVYDRSGQQIDRIDSSVGAYNVVMSPAGDEMVVNLEDDSLLFYDFPTGQETPVEREGGLEPLIYSADGTLFVVGPPLHAFDRNNPETAPAVPETAYGGGAIRFDGQQLHVLGDGGLIWDMSQGTARQADRPSTILPGHGRFVLTENDQLFLHEDGAGKALRILQHPDGSDIYGAVSDDGTLVAMLGKDKADLSIYDADSGELLKTLTVGGFGKLRFSPDGGAIVVGLDQTPELWNWRQASLVHRFTLERPEGNWPPDLTSAIEFSPDGRHLLIGGIYIGSALWDVESGARIWRDNEQWVVTNVGFSGDGKRLVLGFTDAVTIRDALTGKVLKQITTGESNYQVALSGDYRLLAVQTPNGLKIHNSDSGELLLTSAFTSSGEWVAMTPEGFFSASPGGGDYVTASRGLETFSISQLYDALYRPDLVQAKLISDPQGLVAAAAANLDLVTAIESGGAPDIAIVSPVPGSAFENDSVEVVVDLADKGGGIGRIEWRVNGITLGVETRGFDRLAIDEQVAAAEPVRVSRTLSLDPGENAIEILAYNAEGLVASEPALVNVTWTGNESTTPPRLYVLAAGVNDYFDSRLQLAYAASDARAIASAFERAGAGLYESVEVTTVLDADVTASNLDAVFADLGSKVRPRDVFILFMAGHGKTQDGRYYFLPQDFRYVDETSVASGGIDQDRFQEWLSRIPARKSLLLYDTCESGSLTGAVATRGLEEVAALSRMTRAMGRTVLSASTDDAPALEGYNGHGVFTYALLQALGDGDANSDGTIEVTELAGAIDRSVPEISHAAFNLRQVPQMSIVGSDFPIASKVAVLGEAIPALPSVPADPTHVVVAATPVFADAAQSAEAGSLSPGQVVRVIAEEGQLARVAQGGRELGYVPLATLLQLQ